MADIKGPESNAATATGAFEQATVSKTGTKTGLDVVSVNNLIPDAYDYIALSYTGTNLTGVVYRQGGAGGDIVATLVLAYTGAVLDTITRS